MAAECTCIRMPIQILGKHDKKKLLQIHIHVGRKIQRCFFPCIIMNYFLTKNKTISSKSSALQSNYAISGNCIGLISG